MWRKLSLLIVFAIPALLWIDVFTYQGFTASTLSISPKILLLVSLVVPVFILVKRSRVLDTVVVATILLYVTTLTIEGGRHQGYIYDLIYVRPESLLYPSMALLVVAISSYISVRRPRLLFISIYLLALAIGYYLLRHLPITLVQTTTLVKTIATHPTASYADKMRSQWGGFYDYMVYLKETLPEEGTVLGIPPQQKPWLLHGNGMLVKSFIYPSTTVGIDFTQEQTELPPYLMQLSDWPPEGLFEDQVGRGVIEP